MVYEMPKVIAVAGKGGVGKTTLCGMLVRYLVETVKNGPVLAVDADPNSNLNEVLGVAVGATIGEARELMKKDVPAGMTKDVWFEYKVQEAIIEAGGFDLLVMGRPEGQGCYCAANTLAKQSIDTLKSNYAYVVVDNEAGMEHMSRLVTQDIDMLYVVSDGTPRGILTASRILGLINELHLNIRNTCTIINRLKEKDGPMLQSLATEKGIKNTATVRDDEELARADGEGKSIFQLPLNSVALVNAYGIFEKTLEINEQ
jgi:CO dehydrogenase maturation factor